MTVALEVLESVQAALEAAGVRCALSPADVVAPGALITVNALTDTPGTLSGSYTLGLIVWWVPVRQMGNAAADLDALLRATVALAPFAVDAMTWRSTQFPNADGPWLVYRCDIDLLVHP
jgi:hypothetical protein